MAVSRADPDSALRVAGAGRGFRERWSRGSAATGFAAKEQAIVALGKLGDARAVPVLQALSDDRLRSAADGRVVLIATGPAARRG